MPKVSIIVPIFNVEKYLRKCLESLVNQTMQDIEIILVNDASPDHSDIIMQEYGKKYPNLVKCIYLKENLRQGGARNRGIYTAEGEYVTFVDSDDWIDTDYVEKLYQKAEETHSDIVYSDYIIVDNGKKNIRTDVFLQQCGVQSEEKRKANLLLAGTGPCWCLIRKELITEHELFFPEGILYEDMAICPLYAYYAERIERVEGTYYYYYQRDNSVVHDTDAEYQKDEAEAIVYLLKESKKRGIAERFPKEVEAMFTKYFYAWGMYGIYNGKFTTPPKEYMKYLAEGMRKYFVDYRMNPYLYGNIEPNLIQNMYENDREWLGLQWESSEIICYKNYYNQKQIKQKLTALFQGLRDKRITLWGAGKKGREFLSVLKERDSIKYVIDKNEKLSGTKLETGQTVLQPAEGLEETDCVLVINKNYYPEIKQIVKKSKNDIKLLNMDLYLMFDFSLEQCLE